MLVSVDSGSQAGCPVLLLTSDGRDTLHAFELTGFGRLQKVLGFGETTKPGI